MVINIIGNSLLIPQFGIIGASVATVISKLVIGIIVIQKRDKNVYMNMNIRMIAGPVIGASVIACICCLIKLAGLGTIVTVVVAVLLSVIAYGGIMILFRNEIVCGYLSSIKVWFTKHR